MESVRKKLITFIVLAVLAAGSLLALPFVLLLAILDKPKEEMYPYD